MANFGNHRYSHGPEKVSQSHSHVPKTAHDITQTARQIAYAAYYGDNWHDFVSRGFEETLINLTAIEIIEYLLQQLNKLSNFSCDIDHTELCPCTWDIKARSYNYSF